MFSALYLIVSGAIGGMIASAVLPLMFNLRFDPIHVLLACMIVGSFVGFLISCIKTK
jgi:uncharacterized membrane protein